MEIEQYRLKPGSGINSLSRGRAVRQNLGEGEVRVSVRAIALNARDLLIADGHYPASDSAVVLCSDGAGVVVEAAPDCSVAVGDRVVGRFFRDWDSGPATPADVGVSYGCQLDGWLATEVVMPCKSLVRIPDGISFAEASCAPCAGVTAWNAMFEFGQLKSGDSMLVQGTGGVAVWGAQLAEAANIRCIITSSSDHKLAALSDRAGLHQPGLINYLSHPEWALEVARLTQDRGVDLVLELGGLQTISQSIRSVSFGGRIAIIGGLSGWAYPAISPVELLVRQITLRGLHVGSGHMLESLLAFMGEHKIRPVVAKRFSFDRVPDAFEEARHPGSPGKIVVELE